MPDPITTGQIPSGWRGKLRDANLQAARSGIRQRVYWDRDWQKWRANPVESLA